MGRCSAIWTERIDDPCVGGGRFAALLSKVRGSTAFNTREWLEAAAANLPEGRTLHVLCVMKEDELAGCIPLTRGTEIVHRVRVTSLRLLGEPLSDRVALLVGDPEEDLYPIVLDALVGFPRSWDVIVLNELYDGGMRRDLIEGWSARRGIPLHWRHCSRAPVMSLGFPDADALRASYPRSLRTRLDRSRKKLMAAGDVSFERLLPRPGTVDTLLREFKAVEDSSWKGREGVGIFSTDRKFRFFRELSARFAANGWLDVGSLRLDGRLISYRYGFRFRNAFLDYNLAFDSGFEGLSPGRNLLDEMIRSSLAQGLDAVDASRGGLQHGHQLGEWTERYVDHYDLWIFGAGLRSRLLASMCRALETPGLAAAKTFFSHAPGGDRP